MLLQKLAAATAFTSILGCQLPAFASEILLNLDCVHPTRGEETCEIRFPNLSDTNLWDVTWRDGQTDRIRLVSNNDIFITIWNPQMAQWTDPASLGFCFDSKCIHFEQSYFLAEYWPDQMSTDCFHPTYGNNICQVEYVPETDGMRVYWPDNSVDHFLSEEPFRKWDYSQNWWVEVTNVGFCFEQKCLLIDQSLMNAF